jgi:hypothetical protein
MPSKTSLASVLDPKRIEKQNAAFHRMSNKRQRIAIAEDVLAQLKTERYRAEQGTYVQAYGLENLLETKSVDLQTVLLGDAPQCNVCGLGAAFCSMARLGDQATLDDVNNIHTMLEPIFGWQQVVLIESAFEGDDFSSGQHYILSEEEIKACQNFFDKRPDDNKRLAAIFRNIIKNEGTFKP